MVVLISTDAAVVNKDEGNSEVVDNFVSVDRNVVVVVVDVDSCCSVVNFVTVVGVPGEVVAGDLVDVVVSTLVDLFVVEVVNVVADERLDVGVLVAVVVFVEIVVVVGVNDVSVDDNLVSVIILSEAIIVDAASLTEVT